jgi:sulfoquinovosidase
MGRPVRMKIVENSKGVELFFNETKILSFIEGVSAVSVGHGVGIYKMERGNFTVREGTEKWYKLSKLEVLKNTSDHQAAFIFYDDDNNKLELNFVECDGILEISFPENVTYNRVILPFEGGNEGIYGGGEQYLKFNLKGEKVDCWVSEHVNLGSILKKNFNNLLKRKTAPAPFEAVKTYFAQPSYISSKKYFLLADTKDFVRFDFTHKDKNQVLLWGKPKRLVLGAADNYKKLLQQLTDITGRQPALPDWVYNGMILGIQDGFKAVHEKIRVMENSGAKIAGVWCQDWQGQKITAFGKQLFWNWEADETLYPNFEDEVKELNKRGIKFLGYINPFLADGGPLFLEAKDKGYLVLNQKKEVYLVKSTTFYAGMVDLINPEAYEWIKNIIKNNMIKKGLSGWMADFGEYLPTDALCHGEVKGEDIHNLWPVLWAQVNREAVEETGKLGEIVFFTRSGYTGTGKYSTMMWCGDQHVDFSSDYGMPCVVPAKLSLGMSGFGLVHSDVGGYTTFLNMVRTKELYLRWMEMAAFTPMLRSHEGNQPQKNVQFDTDKDTIALTAKMSRIFAALAPYTRKLVEENQQTGTPVIRPLFFHYDEEAAYSRDYEYLYGSDLLVAPVLEKGAEKRTLYLPDDKWIHLWTGKEYHGGEVTIEAPIGQIPVFYRKESLWKALFETIKNQ